VSEKRKKELERLLRKARQHVFEDVRWERVIVACKRRLGTDREDTGRRWGEDYARTMWM
jgi:hypothetical protein